MIPKQKEDILLIGNVLIIIIGFGIEYYGYHLIHNGNDRKVGYFWITLGLIILIVNAIIMVWKVKK